MLFLCFLTRTTRFSFSEATLFFQGYQLLHRMDPFINQMLAEEHWCRVSTPINHGTFKLLSIF
ncbi:unnamed protein product [Brassica rapa subsp. trilocularis]